MQVFRVEMTACERAEVMNFRLRNKMCHLGTKGKEKQRYFKDVKK